MRGKKSEHSDVDLGLAISALSLEYGETRTFHDIAAFCGCSTSNIQQIADKAMRKLRKKIFLRKDRELCQLLEELAAPREREYSVHLPE